MFRQFIIGANSCRAFLLVCSENCIVSKQWNQPFKEVKIQARDAFYTDKTGSRKHLLESCETQLPFVLRVDNLWELRFKNELY